MAAAGRARSSAPQPGDRAAAAMGSSGIPGLALGVVFDDEIIVGPAHQTYRLHPYDGDRMWWQFAGENAGPPAAATFTGEAAGPAASFTLDHFDEEGLGPFTRTE